MLYADNREEDEEKAREWLYQARDGYNEAITIATQANDEVERIKAEDWLAYSLYFYEPSDKAYAEKLARKLQGNPDAIASKRILEDIKRR